MAVLGFLFFAGVLVVAVASIAVTLRPRLDYIADLLAGGVVPPTVMPVATRRRVRRITPLSGHPGGYSARAAA